jgi:hypothetical protein
MEQPKSLASSIAAALERLPEDSRVRPILTDQLEQDGRCARRRAAVLKHADLRRRLEVELEYRRADQWNGWIPPAFINPGGGEELCRSIDGIGHVRLNQRGKYASGEELNNSPRRAALLEISRLAWDREQVS